MKEKEVMKIDRQMDECSCRNAHNVCANNFCQEERKVLNFESLEWKSKFIKKWHDRNDYCDAFSAKHNKVVTEYNRLLAEKDELTEQKDGMIELLNKNMKTLKSCGDALKLVEKFRK